MRGGGGLPAASARGATADVVWLTLATIYGVETRALNQAASVTADRFPPDFAFRLSRAEAAVLAFTEHGAILAGTVLNSPRAVQMSIFVVRAFLRLREWVTSPRSRPFRPGRSHDRVSFSS